MEEERGVRPKVGEGLVLCWYCQKGSCLQVSGQLLCTRTNDSGLQRMPTEWTCLSARPCYWVYVGLGRRAGRERGGITFF